ncbi:MAG: hypothetical protein J2P41_05160 [Blastocatellia bacterium]|nr:hypothetical protein [Blastocatellia bacterium]
MDRLIDFLVNLASEAVGIIFTVFILDRMLKRREERLWLTSKHHIYRKLFELCDGFLLKVLRVTPAREPRWFYFGAVKILGSEIFSKQNEFQARSMIEASMPGDTLTFIYDAPYLNARNEVEGILHNSAHILGPELTALLVSFNNSVSTFIQSIYFDGEPDFKAIRQVWVEMGMSAFNIRVFLEKSADRCMTLREDLSETLKNIKPVKP